LAKRPWLERGGNVVSLDWDGNWRRHWGFGLESVVGGLSLLLDLRKALVFLRGSRTRLEFVVGEVVWRQFLGKLVVGRLAFGE
jgi:hypothetical protein